MTQHSYHSDHDDPRNPDSPQHRPRIRALGGPDHRVMEVDIPLTLRGEVEEWLRGYQYLTAQPGVVYCPLPPALVDQMTEPLTGFIQRLLTEARRSAGPRGE